LFLDAVALENRVRLHAIHSQNTGELKVVEPALAEKLHRARFLRVGIQIRVLLAQFCFDIPWEFQSDRHARRLASTGESVHVLLVPSLCENRSACRLSGDD